MNIEEIYEYDLDSTPEELDEYCQKANFVFNLAGVNRPENPEDFMKGNFGFACIVVCARFGQNRHILEQPQEMFVKQLSILRPCIVHSFCL